MIRRFTMALVAMMFGVLAPISVQAQAVVPHGTLGSLPVNCFGGSGIPCDSAMVGGTHSAVIGLEAHESYNSTPVGNNGMGTYTAETGSRTGAPVLNNGFAKWNFGFYTSSLASQRSDRFFSLFVDTSAVAGNTLASMVRYDWVGDFFDSTNLGYYGPSVFNPDVAGEYTIALYQYADAGRTQEDDYVAISVVTSTPEPASMALLATGLVGIGGIVRRRRRKQQV